MKKRFGIELVIHMDPVETNNEKVQKLKEIAIKAVIDINTELTIHDFRVVDGPTHTNLVFDVVVPHEFEMTEEKLKQLINDKINAINSCYRCVITVDNCYI